MILNTIDRRIIKKEIKEVIKIHSICKKINCNKLVKQPNKYCKKHRFTKEEKKRSEAIMIGSTIRRNETKMQRDFIIHRLGK